MKLLDALQKKYPKSAIVQQLMLKNASGQRLKDAVVDILTKGLRKGV